jgi:hypothetical protein
LQLSQSYEESIDGWKPSHREQGWIQAFTVERASYAVCLLLAACLRFFQLGVAPLSTLESLSAWRAWQVVNGLDNTLVPYPGSALLFAGQSVIFWLFEANDFWARFLPAIASVLLVLLPWWMRAYLGRKVALSLALLLALDPWLTAFGRIGDGTILSVWATLLLFTAAMQLITTPAAGSAAVMVDGHDGADVAESHTIWRVIAAVALGMLLTSGPLAIPLLIVAGIFGWLYYKPLMESIMPSHWRMVALAAITVGVVSTVFLTRLGALGMLSASMSYGLGLVTGSQMELVKDGYPLIWVFQRVVADQLPLALLGLIGMGIMLGRTWRGNKNPWLHFLLVWLVIGLIFNVLPGRGPQVLVLLGLPLLFAAAYSLEWLVQLRPPDLVRREGMIVVGTITTLVLSGGVWWVWLLSSGRFDGMAMQALIILLLLGVAILYLYGMVSGWGHPYWALAVLLLAASLFYTIGSNTHLNHRWDIASPAGLYGEYTSPEIYLLIADIERLSSHRTGSPHEAILYVAPEIVRRGQWVAPNWVDGWLQADPLLGWYLRDMRKLSWGAPIVTDDVLGAPVLVLTAAAEDLAVDGGFRSYGQYLGSTYRVRGIWNPSELLADATVVEIDAPVSGWDALVLRFERWWSVQAQPLARWVIYREVKEPFVASEAAVELWVRAD